MSKAPSLVDRREFRTFKKYKAAATEKTCQARGCEHPARCVIAIERNNGELLVSSACILHFEVFERVFKETRESEGS